MQSDAVDTEVLVPGTQEETWEAITDPDQLGEWFAEESEIDLTPGGGLRFGSREGWVEEVDEPRRISFWWAREGDESSRVVIELEPEEEGTVVRVVESRPLHDLTVARVGSPELSAVG